MRDSSRTGPSHVCHYSSLRAIGQSRSDLAGRGEQFGVLPRHREVFVFVWSRYFSPPPNCYHFCPLRWWAAALRQDIEGAQTNSTSTHHLNACPSIKSRLNTLASLPHSIAADPCPSAHFALFAQRRHSQRSVRILHASTRVPLADIASPNSLLCCPRQLQQSVAAVSAEEIRWLATLGFMVTSEPGRDKMGALTPSIGRD